MNAVQRFFRRYIISTIGIVVLFLAVNIVLFFAILILGSMSGSDAVFSVETFSDHVSRQDGTWRADDVARSMLEEHDAWAMLLNEEGDVIWQQDLPENLPRSYTSAEVASFSRWYLEDYPVKVWTRPDGKLMSRRIFYQPFFDRFPDFAKYEECGKSDDTHSARYPESKSRKSGASGGTGGACRDQRRVEPGRRLYEAKGQHESGVDSWCIPRHPHTAFNGAGVCQRAGR